MPPADPPAAPKPFVPAEATVPEFTVGPILLGVALGIVFGASSVYLVLKVGLTISASLPVAVLAITLFRGFSRAFGLRPATILENNIVQTTGSAGESIAFGVGLVMPALLLLGYGIDLVRVMTVGVLGGLLGILMMIPLRRAFVVEKHHELKYPEGTAAAEVLIVGEKGGGAARTLFAGFGLALVYQFAMLGLKLWQDTASVALWTVNAAGKAVGLKGGVLGLEASAPLLGVGYIIGPRIAGIMVSGGVLAYLVLVPAIVFFGDAVPTVLPPAASSIDPETGVDKGLIRNMSVSGIRSAYILYIGAGAVAAGGLISMVNALPVILGSLAGAVRDFRARRDSGATPTTPLRTERDLPNGVVVFGSLALVFALAAAPSLGLGFTLAGLAGGVLILLFGFLFTTVSSRLTGEIGSSSNPISGMTVATLLLTCLILLTLTESGILPLDKPELKLLALTIAGVVCVACSNGGTTSQALKTGHLVGATPIYQQYAILIGSLTSALVIGGVLLLLNQAGTVYSTKNLPDVRVDASKLTETDRVRGGEYIGDPATYRVLHVVAGTPSPEGLVTGTAVLAPGRYFVADDGRLAYYVDPAINGTLREQDNGQSVGSNKFEAPKTQLIALIINGILDRALPWDLVLIGVLIAVTLELSGVPSLPFAVGVYLPLSASTPIFVGGLIRGFWDWRRRGADEGDSGPGVLLASGLIAGGSIAALLAACLAFTPEPFQEALDLGKRWGVDTESNGLILGAFGVLVAAQIAAGGKRVARTEREA